MSLTVTCPDCDKTLKVKDEAAGKKVRCPGCSKVLSIPAKSNDSDDDFLSGLNAAASPKRKRRHEEDDFDDEDDLPIEKPRAKKPSKKKSGKGKSSGTNWLLIGGLSGAALVAVLFLAILVAAIGQARKNKARSTGNVADLSASVGNRADRYARRTNSQCSAVSRRSSDVLTCSTKLPNVPDLDLAGWPCASGNHR